MEWQLRSLVFRIENPSTSVKRKQPSLFRYLLLDKQVIILTAILALTRGHWIFWFLGVEGEVWIHVCWAVVEQPEKIKRRHTGKTNHYQASKDIWLDQTETKQKLLFFLIVLSGSHPWIHPFSSSCNQWEGQRRTHPPEIIKQMCFSC